MNCLFTIKSTFSSIKQINAIIPKSFKEFTILELGHNYNSFGSLNESYNKIQLQVEANSDIVDHNVNDFD